MRFKEEFKVSKPFIIVSSLKKGLKILFIVALFIPLLTFIFSCIWDISNNLVFGASLKIFMSFGILISILLILGFIIAEILYWRSFKYKINLDELESSGGLISKFYAPVAYNSVLNVWLEKPFFGKLFNYGNIIIQLQNLPSSQIVFWGVKNAEQIIETIHQRIKPYSTDTDASSSLN